MKPNLHNISIWEQINKSLAHIWQPIAHSIGIPYPDTDDVYSFDKQLYSTCKHYDDNLWEGLTSMLKRSVDSLAVIIQNETRFRISLPDISEDLFRIWFTRETNDGSWMNTVSPEEVEGKYRLEVIDYLTKQEEIPSFQYVSVEIHAGEIWESGVIGRNCTTQDLCDMAGAIADGLLKTPAIYGLLKSAREKQDEKHRMETARESAQEDEDKRLACEFAKSIKPILDAAGWDGGWRVYKEYLHYVLELQLTKTDVVRYGSPSQDDVISQISALVRFVNDYKVLNDASGNLCVMKDWNIVIAN